MRKCDICKKEFKPKNKIHVYCGSKECEKKRQQIHSKKQREKKYTIRKTLKPKPCEICKAMFQPRATKTVTCGNLACKQENSRRLNIARREREKKNNNTELMYFERLPTPSIIKDFQYTMLLEKFRIESKGVKGYKDHGHRSRDVYAHKRMNKLISDMEDGPNKELLILEREYIRKVEVDRLKRNIEAILGSRGTEGDYTLGEIGSVLGITRERVRQLETSVIKFIKHPDTGRSLKDYLDMNTQNEMGTVI